MKRPYAIGVGLLVVGLVGLQYSSNAAQTGAGWNTLFDGSSLAGWNTVGDANWRLAEGAVEADKGTGFLVTQASYGDFQLKVEFWVDADANSGVLFRCSDPKQISPTTAYEVNINDKRPDPTYGTGAIVNVGKQAANINTGGHWNTYEITAQGPHLTVTLNGMLTVDVQNSAHARGPIALQYAAGIVKFRNVQIRTS